MVWNQFGDCIDLDPDIINPDPHHWFSGQLTTFFGTVCPGSSDPPEKNI